MVAQPIGGFFFREKVVTALLLKYQFKLITVKFCMIVESNVLRANADEISHSCLCNIATFGNI